MNKSPKPYITTRLSDNVPPPYWNESHEDDAFGESYLAYAKPRTTELYENKPRLKLLRDIEQPWLFDEHKAPFPKKVMPMTDPVTGQVYNLVSKRGPWYILNKMSVSFITYNNFTKVWEVDKSPVFVHFLKLRHFLKGVWVQFVPHQTFRFPAYDSAVSAHIFKELREAYDGEAAMKPEDREYKLPAWHKHLPNMVIVDDLSDETMSPEQEREVQAAIKNMADNKDVVVSNMVLRNYGKPLTDHQLLTPPENE